MDLGHCPPTRLWPDPSIRLPQSGHCETCIAPPHLVMMCTGGCWGRRSYKNEYISSLFDHVANRRGGGEESETKK
jgi:hypothetical protein